MLMVINYYAGGGDMCRSERQVRPGRGNPAASGLSLQQRICDTVRAGQTARHQCQGRHQPQGRKRSYAASLRHPQRSRHGHQGQCTLTVSVPHFFGWGKGGKVTAAGWQVTLCEPTWHVISRSGVVKFTNCYTLFTYLLFLIVAKMSLPERSAPYWSRLIHPF